MTTQAPKPLRTFCSYSHKDEEYLNELRTWLRGLERQGLIEWWHDREITPGWEWEEAIDKNLRTADVILLLVTPDFMASDYVFEKEISKAVERHKRGETRVIPIIVTPADWEWASFAELQALPRDAKPITTWPNQGEAWLDVVRGIRRAVQELLRERQVQAAAEERYREALEQAWIDNQVSDVEAERLAALASELDVSTDTAADIERQVMGDTIETILERQEEAAREEDRHKRLEELYTQVRRLHRDRKWQSVFDVFEQIRAEDPAYPDREGLLVSAREAMEAQELARRVPALYAEGQRHMDAREWQQALECFEEVQRLKPGYQETEALLSRMRQELASPPTVEVPDLSGQKISQASSTLASSGLKFGVRSEVPSDTVSKGRIIQQSPASGTKVEAGNSVDVKVSSDPSTVEVPDLAGKDRSEARSTLHSANLVLGMIAKAPSDDMPEGRIIKQSPVAGRKIERGSSVRITLSSESQKVITADRPDHTIPEAEQTSNIGSTIQQGPRVEQGPRVLGIIVLSFIVFLIVGLVLSALQVI
jgi:tetratricopeptide (TPR) repeat protein